MPDYSSAQQAAITRLGQVNGDRYSASNTTGLGGSGYKAGFPQACNDAATAANAIKAQADAAKSSADQAQQIAVNAPVTTSATSMAIASSGTKVFTCSTNLATVSPFRPTMWVKASSAADPTKYMWGYVPAGGVNATTGQLSIVVSKSGGSGTVADWYIIATGPDGAANGIANLEADTDPNLGGDLGTNGHDILVESGDKITLNAASAGIECNGALVIAPTFTGSRERRQDLGNVSNTVTFDLADGNHIRMKLAGNATITLPDAVNIPDDVVALIIFQVRGPDSGSYTLSWDARVNFPDGANAIAPAAGKTAFFTVLLTNEAKVAGFVGSLATSNLT